MTEDRAALVGRLSKSIYAAHASQYRPDSVHLPEWDDLPAETRWHWQNVALGVLKDQAAALAMQPPGDGVESSAYMATTSDMQSAYFGNWGAARAWAGKNGHVTLIEIRWPETLKAVPADHAAQLAAKDKWIEQLTGERFSERNHTALQSRARDAEQRAEAAMGLLRRWLDWNNCQDAWPSDLVAETHAALAGGAAEVAK